LWKASGAKVSAAIAVSTPAPNALRTAVDPLTCVHSIRAAIASVASIERDAQYSRQRLFSILFGVFSAMALGLTLNVFKKANPQLAFD
jgi:hypothetical protein